MNSEQRLRGATAWQWNPVKPPESITGSVEQFLSSRKQQFNRCQKIVETWENTLPETLQNVCRLEGFSGGVLTVSVSTGPYLHQMQVIQKELLEEMKRQCPQSGIQKIKILPGHIEQESANS